MIRTFPAFCLILAILAAYDTSLAAAEPLVISGTILDQQGQPLKKALNFTTDHAGFGAVGLDGLFKLDMPEGFVAGMPVRYVIRGYKVVSPPDGAPAPAQGFPVSIVVVPITSPVRRSNHAVTSDTGVPPSKPPSPVDTVVFGFADKAEKGDRPARLIALRNLLSMRELAKPAADRVAVIIDDPDIEIAIAATEVLMSSGGDSAIVLLHLRAAIQDIKRPEIQIAALRAAASTGQRGRELLDVIEPLATDTKSTNASLWIQAVETTINIASELKPMMAKTVQDMNVRAPATAANADRFCEMATLFGDTAPELARILIPFSDRPPCSNALKLEGSAARPWWVKAIQISPFTAAIHLGINWIAIDVDSEAEAAREVCARIDTGLSIAEAAKIGPDFRWLVGHGSGCSRAVAMALLGLATDALKRGNSSREIGTVYVKIGEPMIPELRGAATSTDPWSRLEAVRALSAFSELNISEQVRSLGDSLGSKDDKVVRATFSLLEDLGPRSAILQPAVIDWLRAHFAIDYLPAQAAAAIVSMGPVPEDALRMVSTLAIMKKHDPGFPQLAFLGVRPIPPSDHKIYFGKIDTLTASIKSAGHPGELSDATLSLLLELGYCKSYHYDRKNQFEEKNEDELEWAARDAVARLDEGVAPGLIRLIFGEAGTETLPGCAVTEARTVFERVAPRAGAVVPLILPVVAQPPRPGYDKKHLDYSRNLTAIELLAKMGPAGISAIDGLIAALLEPSLAPAAEKVLLALGAPAREALETVSKGPNKKLRSSARSVLAKFN